MIGYKNIPSITFEEYEKKVDTFQKYSTSYIDVRKLVTFLIVGTDLTSIKHTKEQHMQLFDDFLKELMGDRNLDTVLFVESMEPTVCTYKGKQHILACLGFINKHVNQLLSEHG